MNATITHRTRKFTPQQLETSRAISKLVTTSENIRGNLPDVSKIVTSSKQIQSPIPKIKFPLVPHHQKEPAVFPHRRVSFYEHNRTYPEREELPNQIKQELEFITPPISEKREALLIPSIFDWDTLALVIEGKHIKLTATEKNVCCAFFKNNLRTWMSIEDLEYAVYGSNNSASRAFDQALKRINQKVRKAGFSNIFKVEGKNVLLIR